MPQLSPIIIFAYKRLDSLKYLITNLSNNFLASASDLIIFSDGGKNESESIIINEVRLYLKTITGFKSIKIINSTHNKGLADSIIDGVSEVINQFGKVIVLEDDLIPSKNFLIYMNSALDFYCDNDSILSISGYSPNIKGMNDNESYFTKRSSSWGWATWRDKWNNIDWSFDTYDDFIRSKMMKKKFNQMGSDLTRHIFLQKSGLINSWAIRYNFHQFNYNLFSVHPSLSKIKNIGMNDIYAENTIRSNHRFSTNLDNTNNTFFEFEPTPILNPNIIKQFTSAHSISSRIINKFNFDFKSFYKFYFEK